MRYDMCGRRTATYRHNRPIESDSMPAYIIIYFIFAWIRGKLHYNVYAIRYQLLRKHGK